MSFFASVLTAAVVGILLVHLSRQRSSPRHLARKEGRDRFGLDVTRSQFWLSSMAAGSTAFVLVYALTSLAVVSIVPAGSRGNAP